MKLLEFNVNYSVRVKLTKYGHLMYLEHYKKYRMNVNRAKTGKDGYSKFQMHDFMAIFGEHFTLGNINVIEGNNLYICDKDLKNVQ